MWYDHLPYMPFPDDWPVFAPKDKIGDWLEMYTKVMELNYWASTEARRRTGTRRSRSGRSPSQHKGETVTLRPKHLVFATRHERIANLPSYPGMDELPGHAGALQPVPQRRRLARQARRGGGLEQLLARHLRRSCGRTAHTSPWCSARPPTWRASDTLMDLALGGLYSEAAVKAGVDTDTADLIFASLPYKALPALQVPVYTQMKERDAEFYARLEKAGFMLDLRRRTGSRACS